MKRIMQPSTILEHRAARIGSLGALFLLAGLTGCGRKEDFSRAAHGSIDHHAAVQTTVQVTIKAPPAVIWKVLSDISRWPAWQTDIQTTVIATPPAAGVAFEWVTSGGTIHSRLVLYEPERRMSWIGTMLVFHAIHVWELASLSDGEATVTTTESLSGWPIGWFYSSRELHDADQRWLIALKGRAEQMAEGLRRHAD